MVQNKKGLAGAEYIIPIALIALVVMGGIFTYQNFYSDSDGSDTDSGAGADTLSIVGGAAVFSQVSVKTYDVETSGAAGTGDLKLYALGADVDDDDALETIAITNGSAADFATTAFDELSSESTNDLYFVPSSGYYVTKVADWEMQKLSGDNGKALIAAPQETGKQIPLMAIGTVADLDSVTDLTTGFTNPSSDSVVYDLSDGNDGAKYRISLGNSKSKSSLEEVVFCVSDPSQTLEGNEFDEVMLTHVSGHKFFDSKDITSLFEDAAGNTGEECISLGSAGSSEDGEYDIEYSINEANLAVGETWKISSDDYGGLNDKDPYGFRTTGASGEDHIGSVQA